VRPRPANWLLKLLLPVAIAIAILALTSETLVRLLTEAWWFAALDFAGTFWKRLGWQVLTWVATFAAFAAFLGLNAALALRSQGQSRRSRHLDEARGALKIALPIAIALLALIAASSAAGWETPLKFIHASSFGTRDPVFERDIGFYAFRLPFYQGLHGWLLGLVVAGLAVTVPLYALAGGIDPQRGWRRAIAGRAKTHVTLLLVALALLLALGFWLERYQLLYSTAGAVTGAGFTDIHARLPGLEAMSVVAVALAVMLLLSLQQTSLQLPALGVGGYAVAALVLTQIYPSLQQQLAVAPNELAREKPYLEREIALTRQAYRLDEVERSAYPGNAPLERQDLEANQATVRNIRLWDYRPLETTYQQLQGIRPYYTFPDVDVDRYTLNGNYRQVTLAARELADAPSDSWVSQRLKYTHGYGAVMSPVNTVTPQGLPELFIKDIPPQSSVDTAIEQPAIYYGEQTQDPIFTGTSTPEFDYPRGDGNAQTRYDGQGGVPMGSLGRRLAYAYQLGNLKVAISSYFGTDSRIHYHRQIRDRVARIAPFLRLDGDPYLVVADGRLKWLIEGYTVSDRYPYAEPVSGINRAGAILEPGADDQLVAGGFNYARNSVKIAVDAYDGSITFYAFDGSDPLLATYRRIFPELFEPQSALPEALAAHVRYPLNLFNIQAQMYLRYHMRDAETFYSQEDLWRYPVEQRRGQKGAVEPYYIIMRLPEADGEEFALILPFTPEDKDNAIGWMAARSDGDRYGQLRLYQFPKQELVFGPSQIEARINQNPDISEQLSLWDQRGSRVIRGNLLTIPIAEALLYIEPVYLRAEQGELPELKRVIAAYQEQTIMRPTLEDALSALFAQGQPQAAPSDTAPAEAEAEPPEAALPASRVRDAREALQAAREAARNGNWAQYGNAIEELDQLLQQLAPSDSARNGSTQGN